MDFRFMAIVINMTQHVESETYSETADTGTHINEATDSEA